MSAQEMESWWRERNMAAGRDCNSASGASVLMIDSSRLLPLIMLACFLAGGALIGTVMVAWLLPARIVAEVRAENAQGIANTMAHVDVAKYEASLAKTIAQRLDEKDKLRSK